MKLKSVELHDKRMGVEIDRLISATGESYWNKSANKIDAIPGYFYKEFLRTRNPLIKPIAEYLRFQSKGKSVWKHRSAEIDRLAKYAYTMNRILLNVNAVGKKQLISRLLDDNNLSLLHEIDMVTHFLRNEFNVDFVEYERDVNEGGRTFDFLVANNGLEAEVECKVKSYDAGRKITRAGFYMLCDEMLKQFSKKPIKCLMNIKCTKRLDTNQGAFIEVVNKIASAIDSRQARAFIEEDFEIMIDYLPQDILVTSDEQARSIASKHLTTAMHLATVSGKEMTFIVLIQSDKKDEVLRSIYEELKKSLDQFTKTRPSLISCYIEGIYPEDWQELQGENGLAYMTTHLLKKEDAEHVYSIAYSSTEETVRTGHVLETTHPALLFQNETCRFPKADNMFKLKPGVIAYEPGDWIRTS